MPKAVSYALKAAQSANERYGSAEAVRCARMGMEALVEWQKVISEQDYTEHKVRLLLELAKAEEYGGDPQEEKDHIQAGIMLLEENLLLVEQAEEGLQADWYKQIGTLYVRKLRKSSDARAWLEKSLLIYERHEKIKHAAEVCYVLGDVYDLAHSISVLNKGLNYAEALGDAALQSRMMSQLTWRFGNKNFSIAEKYAQMALKITRGAGDKISEIRALIATAYIYRRYLKQKTSASFLLEAIMLSESIGAVDLNLSCLNDLGFDYGEYFSLKNEAENILSKSILYRNKIGLNSMNSLSNIGWIFATRGEWGKSEKYFMKAILCASKCDQSLYQHRIGRVYMFQERYEHAIEKILIALKIEQEYELHSYLLFHLIYIAQCLAHLGNNAECIKYLKLSFNFYEKQIMQKNKIIYLYQHTETCRLIFDFNAAQDGCKTALEWLFNNAEDPDDYQPVAEARLIMGKILVDMQSYQEAVPHLNKARTAFAIGKHYALGETMLYLGKAHLGLGRRAEAENLLISALAEFQRLGLRQKEAEAKRLLGLAP